jgi:hypothetical protein
MPESLSDSDAKRILDIRQLIARAATSDSMRWWEDESLSAAGLRLASRLFPRAPERAAARLAMLAARSRHNVAMPRGDSIVHLFDLGDEVELALDDAFHDQYSVTILPAVTSPDALEQALSDLGITPVETSLPRSSSGALDVGITQSASVLERAQRLAAAYVLGDVRQPMFPYIRLDRGT